MPHTPRKKKPRYKAARLAKKAAEAAQWQPPAITEADLLAFQLSHFGDATQPDDWFVDAETSINYDPALDTWREEDGLGYYDDGVKRTLTDQQIEIFRHSEWEQLARHARLAREEEALEEDNQNPRPQGPPESPLSNVSSIDDDLVGLTTTYMKPPAQTRKASETSSLPVPEFSSTNRSTHPPKRQDTSGSADSAGPKKKKERKNEVPYEQRNKRKWEEHIASVEPVKGTWLYQSKTENRLRRELDDVKAEDMELDY